MLVDYIDQHRERFGVEPICTVLRDAGMQIAPSTYYAAKKRPPSARAVRGAKLVVDIKTAHQANLGVYGARKIHAELNREGVTVARCTVERLMRAEGLRGIPREKTRKTTLGDGAETERIKSEAAFAKLAGISPIPAGSGMTSGKHRINQDGHRQLNAAIYRTVIVRTRFHEPTIAYVTRRTTESKPKRDIIRCLKRYVIQEVYHLVKTDPHTGEIRSRQL